MANAPDISVVFPTYRRPKEAAATLELLAANLSLPHEVIILDNSPEPTPPPRQANLRHLRMGGNFGASARNRGIELARAPYILMLDDDSHPLPGGVEAALALLESSPAEAAGVTARVERPDGGREGPPLLPTVFHGCGALFKSDALKAIPSPYPEDFIFYVEEYWVTAALYRRGRYLEFSEAFRVCHRMSQEGRDKAAILARLTRNNRRCWQAVAPEEHLRAAVADNLRRYELVAAKEGVPQAYAEGLAAPVPDDGSQFRLDIPQFEALSLLGTFRRLAAEVPASTKLLLCGAGKFPTLWRGFLEGLGFGTVATADFNPGLIGQAYGPFTISSPDDALRLRDEGYLPVVGHSSFADSDHWRGHLGPGSRRFDLLTPDRPLGAQLFPFKP